MKAALKHIALLLAGLFASIYAEAQDSIEMELVRYEMVCSMCLDLKSRIHCGEEVSREEATSVLNIFVGLNGKLKARKEEMTPAQVQRFENTGKWFSSGRSSRDWSPDVMEEDCFLDRYIHDFIQNGIFLLRNRTYILTYK